MKTSPRLRIIALGVSAAVAAGTLLAVVAPSVANASTSSSVSSIVSKLNSYRHTHGDLAALSRNDFVDLNAEEYAKQYASDPTGNLDTFTPSTALPVDGMGNGPGSESHFTASASGSSTSTLATALLSIGGANVLGGYNYVGVGYATKGSHEYAYVVLLHYNGTPLKRITPGTVTIPATLHVGDTVGPKVHGFTSGVSYTYGWVYNTINTAGSDPTLTVIYGMYGGQLDVSVTAHKAGYAPVTVTSNVSKPIKLGIATAPKTITVSGKRNVGQTLSAPPEGGKGWGPAAADTYVYQWLSNGTNIAGATHSTYVLQPGDYGKRIDLRMALEGIEITAVIRQTHTKSLIGHPFLAVLGSPSIQGGDEAWGSSRTPTIDIFIEGVKYSVKWLLNGKTVSTAFTYTPPESAAGKKLAIEVTGKLSGYAATSVTSASVNVLKKTFTHAPTATISGGTGPGGAAEINDTLTATVTGPSTPAASSYTYQWYLDGVAVNGATHKTYKFKPTVSVLNIGFFVTAHRTGYTPSAGTATIPYN